MCFSSDVSFSFTVLFVQYLLLCVDVSSRTSMYVCTGVVPEDLFRGQRRDEARDDEVVSGELRHSALDQLERRGHQADRSQAARRHGVQALGQVNSSQMKCD